MIVFGHKLLLDFFPWVSFICPLHTARVFKSLSSLFQNPVEKNSETQQKKMDGDSAMRLLATWQCSHFLPVKHIYKQINNHQPHSPASSGLGILKHVEGLFLVYPWLQVSTSDSLQVRPKHRTDRENKKTSSNQRKFHRGHIVPILLTIS